MRFGTCVVDNQQVTIRKNGLERVTCRILTHFGPGFRICALGMLCLRRFMAVNIDDLLEGLTAVIGKGHLQRRDVGPVKVDQRYTAIGQQLGVACLSGKANINKLRPGITTVKRLRHMDI